MLPFGISSCVLLCNLTLPLILLLWQRDVLILLQLWIILAFLIHDTCLIILTSHQQVPVVQIKIVKNQEWKTSALTGHANHGSTAEVLLP